MRLSVSSALASFSLTSAEVTLVLLSTSISSVSSSRLPVELARRKRRSSSSCLRIFLLLLTSSTSFWRCSSSSARSKESTRARSCCSRPPIVTVKLITVTCAKSSGVKCGLASLDVSDSLNLVSYSHSLSASTMTSALPFFCTALSSTGSRMGSSSSSTFSMIMGVPKLIESSSVLRNFLSRRLVTLSPFTCSRFFSHCRPWPWGSIRSGHLDERVTMMPFCTESSSEGRPSSAQSPMVPASTRKEDTLRSEVTGISRSTQPL
mmetsp:Transcript_2703/g.7731  ORF Transcript_2703/g.7731 Transcript_2703/m.7731 type:complete len:263 (+) Transcript_2703:2812-3600(+)